MSRARVRLRLVAVPGQTGMFQVLATNRGAIYPYSNNPIGVIARDSGGIWRHSAAHNPHAGAIFGSAKSKHQAAMQAYRSHRSWVGY